MATAIATVTHDWFHRSDGQAHSRVADVVMKEAARCSPVSLAACDRLLYIDPEGSGLRTLEWMGSQMRRGLLASQIVAAARKNGEPLGGMRVSVGLARERGECRRDAHCHSVTVVAKKAAERAA